MNKVSFMFFCCILLFAVTKVGNSQNVGVNTTGSMPNASAILDLNTGSVFTSPNGKGMLMPQVSLVSSTDATTVNAPATNLMVFNTNATMTNGSGKGVYFWDGTKWIYMIAITGTGTSGQVLTSQGAGTPPQWAAVSASGGVNFVASSTVYGPTASPTKDATTVLDLSGIVGAAERVVMLKISNTSNGSQTLRFKKNGEALSVRGTSGGSNTITLPVNRMGYIVVKTDALGKVMWETSSSFGSKTTTIFVEAYW